MTFGEALELLKSGKQVRRTGWNGTGMFLQIQFIGVLSKMTLPYVYLSTVQGQLIPWTCSQIDMLSDDWELVENTEIQEF